MASDVRAQVQRSPFFVSFASPGSSPVQSPDEMASHGLERLDIANQVYVLLPRHAVKRGQEVIHKVLRPPDDNESSPQDVRARFLDAWVRTAFQDSLYSPAILVLPDEILLARHPLGLEAIWYGYDAGNALCVGSSLEELSNRVARASARPLGVIDWAYHGAVTPPYSPLYGVFAVGQGEVVSWTDASRRPTPLTSWNIVDLLDGAVREELGGLSQSELEQRVEAELEAAIVRSIGGAKTVGALVSGGVDSSLMAALAQRHATVHAATVALPEAPDCDESKFARRAAQALQCELFEYKYTQEQFCRDLPDYVKVYCSPVINQNAVAVFSCSRSEAFAGTNLVLDGEGADSCYFGMNNKWTAIAFTLMEMHGNLVGRAMVRPTERLARLLSRVGIATPHQATRAGLATLLAARKMELWDCSRTIEDSIQHLSSKYERELLVSALTGRFHNDLPKEWWQFEVMANEMGREVRMPYMEWNHLRTALNIPLPRHMKWSWRRRNIVTKHILKRIAAKHLPPDLIYRPKMGFSMPSAEWLPDWPEQWHKESWAAETFGLSSSALARFLREERMSRDFFFLTTIEMFGRLYGWRIPFDEMKMEWDEACGGA